MSDVPILNLIINSSMYRSTLNLFKVSTFLDIADYLTKAFSITCFTTVFSSCVIQPTQCWLYGTWFFETDGLETRAILTAESVANVKVFSKPVMFQPIMFCNFLFSFSGMYLALSEPVFWVINKSLILIFHAIGYDWSVHTQYNLKQSHNSFAQIPVIRNRHMKFTPFLKTFRQLSFT